MAHGMGDESMSDFWEGWGGLTAIIGLMLAAVLALVLFIVVAFAFFGDRPSCDATARAMEAPHQWGFWTGCLIQVDGRLIPLDAYKVVRPTQ